MKIFIPMKKLSLNTVLLLAVCQFVFGQTDLYKNKEEYLNGYIAKTIPADEPYNTYKLIKDSLLRECNGDWRVRAVSEDETYVEAMGFVMMIAAYYGDKDTYDGLLRFYLKKRTENANNMMGWRVSCDSIVDPGSATDGDADVAFSLIVAHEQWGGEYLSAAIEILDILKRSVIQDCSGTLILSPGYSLASEEAIDGLWGGCELMDIMYHTPAFFRVFADVTGDNIWNKLADDTYKALNASAHPKTGLVPDWQSVDGKPGGNSSWRCNFYRYDACRVPWRIALDYLWNGNEDAKEWCDKVSGWLSDFGAENIVDGFYLDGTPHEGASNHNIPFVGGFAVATMCNSQELADVFGKETVKPELLSDTYWFTLMTRGVYMFTLTGKFWKPDVAAVLEK